MESRNRKLHNSTNYLPCVEATYIPCIYKHNQLTLTQLRCQVVRVSLKKKQPRVALNSCTTGLVDMKRIVETVQENGKQKQNATQQYKLPTMCRGYIHTLHLQTQPANPDPTEMLINRQPVIVCTQPISKVNVNFYLMHTRPE